MNIILENSGDIRGNIVIKLISANRVVTALAHPYKIIKTEYKSNYSFDMLYEALDNCCYKLDNVIIIRGKEKYSAKISSFRIIDKELAYLRIKYEKRI